MKHKRAGLLTLIYFLIVGAFLAVTFLLNSATTAIAQMIPVERQHIVIIDAGHGGEDGGATSCTGVLESTFNLQIGKKVNDLFHLLGYKTKMIRTHDVSVYTQGDTISAKKVSDLQNRVKMVNETEQGILVSIHQNTFSDSRYSGAQVFYGPKGQSQQLADLLQSEFCRTINRGSNRKSKKADGIYLMQHIDCTGILVECGFLSNPAEEALLQSDDYQRKLSCVIAGTVANFLDHGTND